MSECVRLCESKCVCVPLRVNLSVRICVCSYISFCISCQALYFVYGVATVSRIDTIIGLFCRI